MGCLPGCLMTHGSEVIKFDAEVDINRVASFLASSEPARFVMQSISLGSLNH